MIQHFRKLLYLIFVLLIGGFLSGQDRTLASVRLEWRNVLPRYRSFKEIKPTLVNAGDVPIYLSRLYPDGAAHLQRFDEAKSEWENGDWSITCGTVANAGVPIEIKARSNREIVVYWQLSTDDWDNPKRFVVLHSREDRPLSGRYRFTLRYALEPWTLVHRPSATYTLTSTEFIVRDE